MARPTASFLPYDRMHAIILRWLGVNALFDEGVLWKN